MDLGTAALFPNVYAQQQAEQRARRQQLVGGVAIRAAKELAVQKKRDLQYEDEGCKVKVKSGHDRRHDAVVTDVIVIDRTVKTEHYHLVIDEAGNVLFEGWRSNH